ncbi:RNA polymerase ECF-type sigma factor [Plesiocystis pacifica SIR-1]|uniref:RNA polymerase ECF-type sigma factor n=1 Tax=Plesiocystis pacifica SIR-1 TaxID=391625 RepID=A6GA71_9BACT|nr:sigma-70 family RNA polymerase sigma factor [Plesiocystis pacifica]EDM77284.1 RNA polymerase ECF-type sigma factor [Plesiocystis pacifica SIR-1]
MGLSDSELLAAWRDGDNGAGEELFDRHVDAVARFFENKVRQGAEDLTQATFLRLLEGHHRLREGSAFRSFVFGIAHNVLREHLRQLARGRKVDPEVESMAELAPGPSTIVAEKQEHRLLLESLRRLPIASQIILELTYWERLPSHEVAEILDIAPPTARRRLSKARQQLNEAMRALAESPEVLESTIQSLNGWAEELRQQLGGPAKS